MDKNREETIKKRILDIIKSKGTMSMSEIHQKTGISFYDIKDIIPVMFWEKTIELEGKKVKLKVLDSNIVKESQKEGEKTNEG